MCAGAIVQARIPKVVIGAMNAKAGCAGSVLNLLQIEKFNHQVATETGVLEKECSALMTGFFEELREQKRMGKTGTAAIAQKSGSPVAAIAQKPDTPAAAITEKPGTSAAAIPQKLDDDGVDVLAPSELNSSAAQKLEILPLQKD